MLLQTSASALFPLNRHMVELNAHAPGAKQDNSPDLPKQWLSTAQDLNWRMLLEPPSLTPSGRPVLTSGEVERCLLDKVDLEFESQGGLPGRIAEAYKGGYIILTNQRLIWVDKAASPGLGRSCQLHLACVHATHKRTQLGLPVKVRLELQVYMGMGMQPMAASDFHASISLLALRCRGDPPDALKQHIDTLSAAAKQQVASKAGTGSGPSAESGAASGTAAGRGARLPMASPLTAHLQAQRAGQQQQQQQGVPASSSGGPQALQPQAAAAQADPDMLRQMVDMGFPLNRSARCLIATRNEGIQQAMDYLLAFGDQPGMDDPLPQPHAAPFPASSHQQASGPTGYEQSSYNAPGYGASAYGQAGYGASLSSQHGPAASAYPSIYPEGGAAYGAASNQLTYGASQAAQALGAMSLSQQLGQYPSAYPPAADAYPQPSYGAPHGSGPAQGSSQASAAHGAQGSYAQGQPNQQLGRAAGRSDAPLMVGVAGIVKREQTKVEESGKALEGAMHDLNALMARAADMVALAQRFRGVMAAGQVEGGDDLLDAETQAQLIALGIASPVTKEMAGARYHHELARQLTDFLLQPAAAPASSSTTPSVGGGDDSAAAGSVTASLLRKYGGMITLPDVYCLFNRARGVELVSPDDLLQACKLFSKLGLPLQLRSFPSGAVVVQGLELSDERICATIGSLAKPTASASGDAAAAISQLLPLQLGQSAPAKVAAGPALGPALSSGDVARALGVSVAVAAEQLLLAESRGVLCRDDGPEGLRFFRNFFKETKLLAAGMAH